MQFEILPLQGTDKLKLNLTSEETKSIFPNEYRSRFKKARKTPTDEFSCFHVYYDENDKSKAIEFWEEGVFFNDIQLIGKNYNEVKDMFEKLDNNLDYEEDCGFTSFKFQIGIYAPYGKVESVIVGRAGYYKK